LAGFIVCKTARFRTHAATSRKIKDLLPCATLCWFFPTLTREQLEENRPWPELVMTQHSFIS